MQRDIEGFRLSPQQTHLWVLQQAHARAGAPTQPYQAQCALRIEGDLQPALLPEALQRLIEQHEILRTGFYRQPGIKLPLQVIAERATLSFQQIDASHLPPPEQDVKVREWFQATATQLQLEQASLLRAALFVLSAQRYLLLLALPALCADGQTLDNFVPAIGRAYASITRGAAFPEAEVQYVQFGEWQNELRASEEELGRKYWQPFEAIPPLTLPLTGSLSDSAPFTPQTYSLQVDPALVNRIAAVSQQHQAAVADVLLSCWQILLWRLSGRSEIVVSVIYSGRTYAELQEVLGPLTKPLPLRCDLQGDFQFTEVLERTGKARRQADRWQEYFQWSASYQAMNVVNFPMSFEFQDQPDPYSVGEVTFSLHQRQVSTDRYQIKLTCTQAETLRAEFDYDASLFSPAQIQSLAGQFQMLLNQVVETPEGAIARFELLTPEERQRLLVDLNQTQATYPPDACVHHLFAAQAACTPNAPALLYEDQQLTYRELHTQSNQLAHHLQTLGVGPEVIVGLYVERSPLMVIGLLGILKAGGAYLPLDPTLPPAAVAGRLQQAQASLLLTQEDTARSLQLPGLTLVYLDKDWGRIAQASTAQPASEVIPANLVYVLFTSGSSGQPKGVAVEHRQLLNYLYGILDKLALPAGASFATVSTLAADLGNTVIYAALASGGRLQILAQARAADPAALADYWQRHPVDCLKLVPSHLAALLTDAHPQRILPRRQLILGGEACPWSLVEQVQELADCRILNHYGPTETTVGVLIHQVESTVPAVDSVPLGRPLANAQVYVLDSHLQPLPVGVPGELYIGGAGVARGYYAQPALTAAQFIPHPFSAEPGARLYKSGDWGCYQPDGTLIFLGRRDDQVKLRGYRVELGEIEGVLRQHPRVRQAIVLVDDAGDQQRLVAYVVALKQPLSPHELRDFLQERLAAYLIPSIVLLKSLPLTPNGKVDRRALSSPDIRPDLVDTYQPPQTAIEHKLVEIWVSVLGLERVGIQDNFFELGGHSLLATQLVSRLRDTFQVELSLHHFFTAPTVAELAVLISQSLADATESDLLAQTLAEVEQLSEEEAQALLSAENQSIDKNE